jgi:hypothetical protein
MVCPLTSRFVDVCRDDDDDDDVILFGSLVSSHQVDPTPFLDTFTLSLHPWKESLFVPVAPNGLLPEHGISSLFESVTKAAAIWNHDAKRRHMRQSKLCWCGQHMVRYILIKWDPQNETRYNRKHSLSRTFSRANILVICFHIRSLYIEVPNFSGSSPL